MADLEDGEVAEIQGSASKPYKIRNIGGVYSCTCPAWNFQSVGIERRTCKHIKALRGEAAEIARLGDAALIPVRRAVGSSGKKKVPPVLLADRWEPHIDLSDWWLSEKLDGVRAYWDGEQFLSRNGNIYLAPDWFLEDLPDEPLDGELWIGRNQFQETVSIVRRGDKSDHWQQVYYVLFDAPEVEGDFETRLQYIEENFAEGTYDHVYALEHHRCQGNEDMQAKLAEIEELGGEGLMARKPGSKYVKGRSSTLLKIKNFHDAEAKVVGHTAGAGRHKGRLGSLDAILEDGTRFNVGTGFSDREREDPPEIGDIITFRYQELTKDGVPRFPSYVGIREDYEWGSGAGQPKQKKVTKAAPKPVKAKPKPKPKPKPVAKSVSPTAVTTKKVATKKKVAARKQVTATRSKKVATKKKVVARKKAVPKAPEPPVKSTPIVEVENVRGATRYFEYTDQKSNKFWEVTVKGCEQRVRYGRIGVSGQTKVKWFDSETEAQAASDKLIQQKMGKGYEEKGVVEVVPRI